MGAINHMLQLNLGGTTGEDAPAAPTAAASPGPADETGLGTMVLNQLDQACIRNRYHRLMLISENGGVAHTFPLNRKRIHIGRSRRSSICIKDAHASVKHLTVNLADGVCVAKDRNSTNGTFINGERLEDFRILKDGDEIMAGKTVFQYASREARPPAARTAEAAPAKTIAPSFKKKAAPPSTLRRLAAAVLMLMLSLGIVFGVTDYLRRSKLTRLSAAGLIPSDSVPEKSAAQNPSLQLAENGSVLPNRQQPPVENVLVQDALDKYAAGQINSAIQALKTIAAAVDNSRMALKSRKVLMRLRLVKELYRRALQAQEQQKFTLALERWDNLLQVDKELVGNRPSFFAVQAGLNVQILSYNQALEAFRTKDHGKARQLCQMILKIDSRNIDALKLLARIEAQTPS